MKFENGLGGDNGRNGEFLTRKGDGLPKAL